MNAGLKSLQKNGKADLKLSAATAKKYTDAVDEFHDTLNLNLQGITSLKSLGSPGSLNSAIETKNNLELDINGLDGVVDSVNQYLDYLTQFKATVTAASKRLIDSG